jgi:hypothetical protein
MSPQAGISRPCRGKRHLQLAQAAPNRCPGVPRLTLQVSSGRWPRRLASPGPPLASVRIPPAGVRSMALVPRAPPVESAAQPISNAPCRPSGNFGTSYQPASSRHSDKRREPAPASASTSTSRPRPTVFAHACKTWHSIRRTLSLPIRPPKMIAPSRSGWPKLPDRGGQSHPRFP